MPTPAFEDGDPFCTQCGFVLRGHEGDAICPECRAPLPAALGRYDSQRDRSKRCVRRESSATLCGWPLVSIAMGPDPDRGERFGRARGVIAIGDTAIGAVAIGGGAVGIVAIGGGAIGAAAVGGGAVGLLIAVGGGAAGGCAVGGVAAGGLATGGVAIGFVAQGGAALGVYARGGSATGRHTISAGAADPQAQHVFDTLAPVMGAAGSGGVAPSSIAAAIGLPLVTIGVLAAVIGAAVLLAQRRHDADRLRRGALFDDIALSRPGNGPYRRGFK